MANTLAASSTLCKCACFGESKLIGLDGKLESSPASPVGKSDTKQGHGTCLDCNKQFCQNYNLPICRDAKEEDVIATCYRMTPPPVVDRPTDLWLERDSAKDQAIVFIFIFATVGLLIYAGLKPWIDRSVDVRWRSVIFAQRD
jgi:hypothetical protein